MIGRKRDDLESGYIYRVVARRVGSDDEWVHTNYWHGGKPRTYMTLGAAKGMRTRMRNANAERHAGSELEFAVQRSPVQNWEFVN